jgi:hypothetical protein
LFPTFEVAFRKCLLFARFFRIFVCSSIDSPPGLSFALTQVHHGLYRRMGVAMTGEEIRKVS